MDLDSLRARELMTVKIVTAERHETLRVASRRMSDHGIHGLLIEPDSKRHGHAILTAKDCIQAIAELGPAALDDLCVEDAMTQPAITVPADLCILECLRLMRLCGVRTAPVADGAEVVGVLTFTDLLDAISAHDDR